jgi:squalene-hopene/tetraprenyl-beta-curcumene cyclase
MSIGRKHGYEVPQRDLDTLLHGMLDISGGARGPSGLSVAGSPSHLIETAKAFGAAAFAQYDERIGPEARTELLQAADALVGYQQEDGSIKEGYTLLPIAAGRTQATMQAAQAFRQAHARTADERWLPPLRKAEAYLQSRARALSDDPNAPTQEVNYALMGLMAAGAGAGEGVVRSLRRRVEGLERPGGGWGFAREDEPNAFATGQTLYALRVAGVSDSSPIIARGTDWLLRHQDEGGGWSHAGFDKAEAMWGVLGLVSLDVVSVMLAGIEDGQRIEGVRAITAEGRDNGRAGVTRMDLLLDDVPIHGACGPSLAYRLDAAGLETGSHILDVVATNAAGQSSRRRVEIYAGDIYLTQLGSQLTDGGTMLSMRSLAPERMKGSVEVRVFPAADGGAPAAGAAPLWTSTQPAAEGPKSVFWNGRAANGEPAPRGRYVAEVRLLDAGGKSLQTERVAFLNDTPEAQRANFAEVEGQLLLDGAAPAANTKVELVDDAGNVVQSAVTTRAGQYRFKNVDKGAYRLRVQKRGFAGDEVRVQAAPAAAPAKADVNLRMQ